MFAFINSQKRVALVAARSLYDHAMEQSRAPYFYADCKVPDTLEGRFEVLALHVGLMVSRLCRPDMGTEGRILAQALFDVMFRNLDWSLREMGVGDLSVPRRIKMMMQSFKGRAFAYDEALKAGDGEIRHALIRNMYGEVREPHSGQLDDMTVYVKNCAESLASQGLSDYWRGHIHFPTLHGKGNDVISQAA